MFIVKPIAEKMGFKFWKPIIWDKVKIGMGYHYRSRYENILFFEKYKRKLNDLSIPMSFHMPFYDRWCLICSGKRTYLAWQNHRG
jgi:DNA modification methylase